MRIVQDPQLQIGQLDIAGIKLDLKSRDDIPHILLGLQHIYVNELLRKEVFEILEQVKPTRSGKELSEEQRGQAVDSNKGRPGMEQWTILVLGVLRLGLNTDYDRIHELANQHQTIRQMLGHGDWCDDKTYNLQTLKDNLRLFTPEILDQINQAVVKAGHALIKKTQTVGQSPLMRKRNSTLAVTPSFWKRMFTFLPTLICSTMRYAKQLKRVTIWLKPMDCPVGANIGTMSESLNVSIA